MTNGSHGSSFHFNDRIKPSNARVRSKRFPDPILKGFSGILQVDGYAGYNQLLKRADSGIALAYCWAHARRKLHEVAKNSTAPIAEDGLRRIAA